jgi:hypothetical protein
MSSVAKKIFPLVHVSPDAVVHVSVWRTSRFDLIPTESRQPRDLLGIYEYLLHNGPWSEMQKSIDAAEITRP